MRPTMRRMIAKYPGTCQDCGKPIHAGDDIRWFGRGRAAHVNCSLAEHKHTLCSACNGSGRNWKNDECLVCGGTGQRKPSEVSQLPASNDPVERSLRTMRHVHNADQAEQCGRTDYFNDSDARKQYTSHEKFGAAVRRAWVARHRNDFDARDHSSIEDRCCGDSAYEDS